MFYDKRPKYEAHYNRWRQEKIKTRYEQKVKEEKIKHIKSLDFNPEVKPKKLYYGVDLSQGVKVNDMIEQFRKDLKVKSIYNRKLPANLRNI